MTDHVIWGADGDTLHVRISARLETVREAWAAGQGLRGHA